PLRGAYHEASRSAGGVSLKAKLLYRQGETEEAIKSLALIDVPSCSDPYVVTETNFLLGKYYDRLGKVDDAFASFVEGNKLQAESFEAKRVDETEFIAVIEKNKKIFSGKMVSSWVPYVSDEEALPVFFAGFPRSGTTLVDQMLNAHSRINVIEEKPLIADLIELVKLNIGPYPEVVSSLDDEQIKYLRSHYASAVKKYLPENCEGHLVVDKFPLHLVHIGFIQKVFYGAKIIFALRHPLDACLSNFMQYFLLSTAMKHFLTLDGTANVYAKIMDLWLHYEMIFDLNLHVFKYENMVEDTENEAKKLIDFLELEWERDVLDFFTHAQKRKSIMTPSYQDVMTPIYKRARFRWKNYRKHLGSVMPKVGPYARAFDYELD
ncbi:MAG: sulfotransferase, partial [Desulfobulbales bacterium]|nr:sulfotransferase [Desulfobulbales bacterium]